MRFGKFVIAMLLIFVIVTPTLAQTPIKWRLTTHVPSGFVWDTLIPRLIERINQASGGRIQIQAFPAGALVPTNEVLGSVGKGVLDMAWTGTIYWRGIMPAADFFWGSPMTLGDNPAQYEYMWWQMGMIDVAREAYAKHNVFFVAPMWSTPYGGTMSKKPIKSLQDIKGVKLRSFGVTSDLWESYGASVVNVPAAEMYAALAMGTIDAAHWSAQHEFASMKIHEVAKYYLQPPTINQIANDIFVNQDKWKSLSPDLQQIVIHASRTTAIDAGAMIRVLNTQDEETMKKAGVTFSTLSDGDVANMRQKAMELLESKSKADAFCSKAAEITKKTMSIFGGK